jgi:uncharacterized protein YecE (DUF72 family)
MLAGTSGYSYKEWCGPFYPDKLPAGEMLRFYASRLPTVEVNNTFYRMPAEALVASWAADVPEGFRFTLKASRSITHIKRLHDVESRVEAFLKRAALLGDKLGAVLFQLPPFFRKDLGRLKGFLALLPPGLDAAVEFRHATWQDDEVYAALRDAGTMLCVADGMDEEDAPAMLIATTDRAYLRMRRPDYDDEALKLWIDRLASLQLERAYIYFKHEEGGRAARMAARFDEMWNARETGAVKTARRPRRVKGGPDRAP